MITNKIGFGGGCHWCTEAIFQALIGVEYVEQGWISSTPPYESFSEGIIVHYNDNINSKILIEIHLLTHSSKKKHRFHQKYRSAIYYFNLRDKAEFISNLKQIELESNSTYITKIIPFEAFRSNSERYLNYYLKDRNKPFCINNINPKLNELRKKYRKLVRDNY